MKYGNPSGTTYRRADALCDWLASCVPSSQVLIVQIAARGLGATVLASSDAARAARGAWLDLPAGCMRGAMNPGSSIGTLALADSRVGGFQLRTYGRDVRIMRIPGLGNGPRMATAALFLPSEPGAPRPPAQLLRALLRQVRPRVCGATSAERPRQSFIVRAKQEWESTVDALPEVICLVDREQRVLRANRAVERWGLGGIRSVLGLPLHTLFHGSCSMGDCELRHALDRLWAHPISVEQVPLDVEDSVLAKTLTLRARPMPSPPPFDPPSENYAVFVATDTTLLRRAQRELRALNRDLECRVAERTAELLEANAELREQVLRREQAEQALMQSRNELSLLSVQLMVTQENERKRIARELHDGIGQSLSAIKYSIERAIELAKHPRLGSSAKVMQLAVVHVQKTMDEVRSISDNLHPPVLDDMGAASAVRWFCREWSRVYTHLNVTMSIDVRDTEVPRGLATAVFRTVQESLNNVAKHAAAREVVVGLRRDGSALVVEVNDDGVGARGTTNGQLTKLGHGLRGMRERAEHTGGELSITAEPGRGTLVRVRWPGALREVAAEQGTCAT
jgi:signal transduction histidine kinase/PAS domain-containing protein